MANVFELFTSFDGRISRKSWWRGYIIYLVVSIAGLLVLNPDAFSPNRDELTHPNWVATIWTLMLIVPFTAITVKRFNDRDWPNWLGYAVGLVIAFSALGPHFGFLSGPEISVNEWFAIAILAIPSFFAFIDNGFIRGTRGPNRYGADPTEGAGRAPSRWWYLVAVAMPVAALGIATASILNLKETVDAGNWIVVPGEAELILDEPGPYAIFPTQGNIVGDQLHLSGSTSPMRIAVRSVATGRKIPVASRVAFKNQVSRGRSGVPHFVFDIAEPGRYRLLATYENGRTEPQTSLTVARNFFASVITAIVGITTFVLAFVAAIVMLVVVWLRRRAAPARGSPSILQRETRTPDFRSDNSLSVTR